ncbi:uncharacterized protein LOC106668520 [Cimex lectularius]|uniref:Bromo domain-containing protein n=1 Tax=Cimex lectularius TaxID=79782 RepID=A0A8I6S3R7_CIMLE|nr:uncharacterized protein LOC106668520 [Cimex lectularius]
MADYSSLKLDEIPKRKRGRPPKTPSTLNTVLEFPTSHLTEKESKELQLGYKILKDILNIPKIKPLLDKPDESCFGLHDYYSIIEKPIWFNEISRKYACKEYKDLKTVIDDIRLVLENCYKFWGYKHKFIKQAYRVEKMLEKHISEFPEPLRTLCSLGEPETSTIVNKVDIDSDSVLTEEYHSKILENLEKKQKETKEDLVSDPDLQKWEAEVLMSKQKSKQISLMSELAEIGHFLRLSQDILCLKDITQYEIERMLLMPRESTTLASIMTCFLCPTAMRGSLYFKPIMIYDVWQSLLNRKLEGWYNAYAKINNKLQLFLKYGIEPYFWEIVGEQNPLTDTEFHALSFTKKACILKALCTTMFHSNKKIEDYFNSVEESSLRGITIFEDSKFEYISLFSPEIRIYRVSKTQIGIEHMIETVLPNFPVNEDLTDSSALQAAQKNVCSKRQKFYLVATDRESLESFLKVMSKKKKLHSAIHTLLAQDQSNKFAIKGLKAMFSQWQKSVKRSSTFIENSINYWINKEASPENTPQNSMSGIFHDLENQGEPVLGKRILKRKFSLEDVESSSNDEKLSEESVSDWEDGNIRRSKRIKPSKSVPRFFDRRFMKFERNNLEDGIFEPDFKVFNCMTSTPKAPEPVSKVPKRINYVSKAGVRIRKAPQFMSLKRSIINAAVENASKLVTQAPDSNLKVLTIDMKAGSNGQHISWQNNYEELHQQSSWICPQPVNTFSQDPYYTPNQEFLSFNESLLENAPQISVPKKDNNNDISSMLPYNQMNIPPLMSDHLDYTLNGQNETLENFQTEDLSQYEPVLYLPEPPSLSPSKFINMAPCISPNQMNVLHIVGPHTITSGDGSILNQDPGVSQ